MTHLLMLLSLGSFDTMAPLPPPLERLCQRIEGDERAPSWKRELVGAIRSRHIGRFEADVTWYCPGQPQVDPYGGGAYTALGLRPSRGHCAVGTRVRAAPFWSVLYCPEAVDHLLVVVDTGPGVNGKNRIDICEPDPAIYRLVAGRKRGLTCWRLRTGPVLRWRG